MTVASKLELIDWRDYLGGEERARHKHEFVNGFVYAMAGATFRHNTIAANVFFAIRRRLQRPGCRVLGSDMKVRIRTEQGFRFYYPDCLLVCGEVDPSAVYIDEPVVVVEVASPSTRRIDEGEKREGYLMIPSLAAYLFVDSERPAVALWRRKGDAFEPEAYSDMALSAPLSEIGVEVPIREFYAGVDWTPDRADGEDE
jgi:Uma2 family endonuclease